MRPGIRDWKEIDADWLSAALATGGVDAKVSNFTAGKVGTGQIGDCVRFKLDYERAEPGAPATLVGKFPAEGEESRSTGIQLGNYHREVKFYQVLQPDARITTPHCYYTDVDEETHEFVLMMGDLAPAEQGDQLKGASLDETRTVLSEAAKLHSAYWNDDRLDDYSWVSGTRDAPSVLAPDTVAALWDGFKARYGGRVGPEATRVGDAMSRNLERYGEIQEGVRGLVHADFRPDNMLFLGEGREAGVTVVDWQSFGYSAPASDVGYFIAGALDPALRRERESELLDHYLAELSRLGVDEYPESDFTRHYIAGAYQHFLTAFFAAMLVTQTARGDDMFFKMLNGAVDLISDHKALDWFE